MVLRDDTLAVPTLDQAQAAAALLADADAAQVLLVGSLCDGTAAAGSDIDLVAIFDNIDYEERYPQKWHLEARCSAAVGAPVDVWVTDWPEWRHRTQHVSSSFEAAITEKAKTLFEREPHAGKVRWSKEIGMPDTNLGEAMDRLSGVSNAVSGIELASRPSSIETSVVDGSERVNEPVRLARLSLLCAHAAMSIENSLKALAALDGSKSKKIHDIHRLLTDLAAPSDELIHALQSLRENTMRTGSSVGEWDDITAWRIASSYPASLPEATLERTERIARLISDTAVEVASITLDRVVSEGGDIRDERVNACAEQLDFLRSALETGDVVNGITPQQPAPQQPVGRVRRWLNSRRARRLAEPRTSSVRTQSIGDQIDWDPSARARAQSSRKEAGARVCGKRTAGGDPCMRRIASGGRCPIHG